MTVYWSDTTPARGVVTMPGIVKWWIGVAVVSLDVVAFVALTSAIEKSMAESSATALAGGIVLVLVVCEVLGLVWWRRRRRLANAHRTAIAGLTAAQKRYHQPPS